jgi:hypothetical protein
LVRLCLDRRVDSEDEEVYHHISKLDAFSPTVIIQAGLRYLELSSAVDIPPISREKSLKQHVAGLVNLGATGPVMMLVVVLPIVVEHDRPSSRPR